MISKVLWWKYNSLFPKGEFLRTLYFPVKEPIGTITFKVSFPGNSHTFGGRVLEILPPNGGDFLNSPSKWNFWWEFKFCDGNFHSNLRFGENSVRENQKTWFKIMYLIPQCKLLYCSQWVSNPRAQLALVIKWSTPTPGPLRQINSIFVVWQQTLQPKVIHDMKYSRNDKFTICCSPRFEFTFTEASVIFLSTWRGLTTAVIKMLYMYRIQYYPPREGLQKCLF